MTQSNRNQQATSPASDADAVEEQPAEAEAPQKSPAPTKAEAPAEPKVTIKSVQHGSGGPHTNVVTVE